MSKILDTLYDGYTSVEKGFSKSITGAIQTYKGTIQVLTSPSVPIAQILDSNEEVITGYDNVTVTYTPSTATSEIKFTMVFDSSPSIFLEGYSYIVLFVAYLVDEVGGITKEPIKIQVGVV